jgi:uncharacterized protein (DUF1778 family)
MAGNILSVRVSREKKTLLERICRIRGEDMSDFVRRSILKELANLSYLSDEERKALGF